MRKVLFFILIMSVVAVKVLMNMRGEEIEAVQVVRESNLKDLMKREEKDEHKTEEKNIRVLILGNHYSDEVHPEVKISSQGRICVQYGKKKEYIKKGKTLKFTPDDVRLKDGKVTISSDKKITLLHLERSYGNPSYEGEIELRTTAEGIVIVNELSVEKYLKAVVPSEMPSSYELEALKAQAVCARSYAYRQMEKYGYPEYKAHVNDSTDYQVYGNVKPQKSTNKAIKETEGQVVYYHGEIATTYYYSTSCGRTTDITAWGTKKTETNAYLETVRIKGKDGDYEKNLPWYKWEAEIPVEMMSNLISLNTKKDIGLLRNIEVTDRGAGNIALKLKVTGEKGSYIVETENKIRAALGGRGYQIKLNDGTMTESRELLPSAFFTIYREDGMFIMQGGGFGHGIGMSQNGANEMAKQGKDYQEILNLFYKDIEIH